METTTLKLLTIIADEALTGVLEDMLIDSGAQGYTLTHVEGRGRSGMRNSTWDGENIKLEVITTGEVVDHVLTYLRDTLFDKYAVIVYYSDVQVIRTRHFTGPDPKK